MERRSRLGPSPTREEIRAVEAHGSLLHALAPAVVFSARGTPARLPAFAVCAIRMLKLWRKVSITVTLDGELWFQQFGDRMHKICVSKIMMDAMHVHDAPPDCAK